MKYTQQELKHLSIGACFLAGGGGGPFETAKNLIANFTKNDYYPSDTFEVISKEEAISQGGAAIVTAYIGSPQQCKLMDYPKALIKSIEQMMKLTDQEIKYIVPLEIGAGNSVIPCLAAAKVGLKVIDCDSCGRAVPELSLCSFARAGVPYAPLVFSSDTGISIQLASEDTSLINDTFLEKMIRPIIMNDEFEARAGLAFWLMDSKLINSAVKIEGTLELCRNVGKIIDENDFEEAIEKINAVLQENYRTDEKLVYRIFSGVLDKKSISQRTAGGFDFGMIEIQNSDKVKLTIPFKNESLIAWRSDQAVPAIMAPDILTFYVHDEQKVYSNSDLIENGELLASLENKMIDIIGIKARPEIIGGQCDDKDEGVMEEYRRILEEVGYYGGYVSIDRLCGR